MSEWKEYKLGELTLDGKGHYGIAAPAVDFDCSKYTYLRITDINDDGTINRQGLKSVDDVKAKEYLLKPNDIVFARTGASVGRSYFYDGKDGELVYAGFLIKFSLNPEKVCPYILKAYTHSQEYYDWIRAVDNGATRGNINAQTFASMPISLPSLEEQKRIAGVLSSLDDKIDLLHRENATLEALAETLFRHYFIEDPNSTCKEGKLGDYVFETIGGEWGKEAPEEEYNMPVRCLRGADVADLNDGLAQRTPLRYIKQSKYDKIEPHSGDIILEISGGTDTCSTGRVAYINDSVRQLFDYPIVFSNFCRLLRVKEEHTYFVYCFFRYLHKQGEFFNLENGSSGIHNLNYKAALYDDLGWPVPTDKKLVIEFGEKVKPYFDKINTNKKQILSLSAQRDTLLPYLMSGDVKVSE